MASQETTFWLCFQLWLVTKEFSKKKTQGREQTTLVGRRSRKFLVTNHAVQRRVLLQLVYSGFPPSFDHKDYASLDLRPP